VLPVRARVPPIPEDATAPLQLPERLTFLLKAENATAE
jgi:hypothetical protein